jgi:hypothetical protein
MLEERALLCTFSQITSVRIASLHSNIRVAPGTPLVLVVQVQGMDSNGNALTLTDTAHNLAVRDGVAVDFHLTRGSRSHRVIRNNFDFLVNGDVTILNGPRGFGAGVVARAACADSNQAPVLSTPFQIVRDTGVRVSRNFDGNYAGSFSGTCSDPQDNVNGVQVGGGVQFAISGRTIQVFQPGAGAGSLSPNGDGTFAYGNGGLTINGIAGSAQFHAGLTLLSDFRVFGGGTWSFQGTAPDGTAVTGSGVWSI